MDPKSAKLLEIEYTMAKMYAEYIALMHRCGVSNLVMK